MKKNTTENRGKHGQYIHRGSIQVVGLYPITAAIRLEAGNTVDASPGPVKHSQITS